MKCLVLSIAILMSLTLVIGQEFDRTDPTYSHAQAHLDILKELLAIPNDAHYPDHIERNVLWCEGMLRDRGFTTQRLETSTQPLLMAEYHTSTPGSPTVLFYFHIDGQPVDGAYWFQEDPYAATLKKQVEGEGWVTIPWEHLHAGNINPEWRIFARSASDDKSPFIMFLAALEALEEDSGVVPYNLKVILDFEEEIGSPSLSSAVAAHAAKLAADMLIIFDGPKHGSDRPTISFGARGITTLTITVFGPTFPQHSGHYGNYAPNPAMRLAHLLATMKDAQGRVTIPGYYDGITLDDETRAILAAVPDDENLLKVKLGIGEIDQVGTTYQESLQYPSLNVRGMSSGWVGNEARTIVPATATAEIDLRLVVESDGSRLVELIRDHIRDQGYYLTEERPTSRERFEYSRICQLTTSGSITRPFRTPLNSSLGQWVYAALKETFDAEPVRIRTMGGTLPTSPFINTLGVPAVIVPLVNDDNNQHSPNENLRLGNYFDGVRSLHTLLSRPFDNAD